MMRKQTYLLRLVFIAAYIPAASLAAQFSCPKATIASLATETLLPWVTFEEQSPVNLTRSAGSNPSPTIRNVSVSSLISANELRLSSFSDQRLAQPSATGGGVRYARHFRQPTEIISSSESWLAEFNPNNPLYPYKTMPDNKIKSTVLELYPDISKKTIDTIVSPNESCDNYTTENYKTARSIIYSSKELFIGTINYLKTNNFPSEFTSSQKQKILDFIDVTREILTSCYIPAEESRFAQSHAILKSIGTIYDGVNPICTALLIGRQGKILTARHCFDSLNQQVQKESQANLWFQPAYENNTYQICSILEKNALSKEPKLAKDDQVIARIAPGNFSPTAITIPPPSELKTPSKSSPEINPTPLVQISQFPFSSLVLPKIFKSGFVQSINPSCIILSKESGCFSHTCSATPGGSGAPIFFIQPNILALAGTHIGDSADDYSDCSLPHELQMNGGTYINDKVRSLIQESP
ncbi:trypsin-like serine peptidase [Pseudomonas sp. PI1]|uniref:trypsin-like serine peptidase n=1 Tax=Pseudomonas sp. PI1 TaxID=1582493 RepID=UPI000AA2CF2D|nr:hypothetical protein [Pseudomonas sp. PI1]